MLQDLRIALDQERKMLKECIQALKNTGRAKAKAEQDYRIALCKEMLLERANGTPVTIISDICRGKEEIAKLKLTRDIRESDWEVCLQKIYQTKNEIAILEKEIYGELKSIS